MQRPTVLLDEQLFGLDEYLRDLGWMTTKVRPGVTDDEVVSLAKENWLPRPLPEALSRPTQEDTK